MNVLRGNVAPRAGMTAGLRIGFRNAVQLNRSNLPDDNSTVARLSGWLPYDNTNLVRPAGTNYAFRVTVTDPDDPASVQLNADVNYRPKRLQVQSFGFGPRGSAKQMEMVVERVLFDIQAKAALAIRGADDNTTPMVFTI